MAMRTGKRGGKKDRDTSRQAKRKGVRKQRPASSSRILKVRRIYFYGLSDGVCRDFGPARGGAGRIPAPSQVSWYNLYVNQSIQPPGLYRIGPNSLHLLSRDVPPRGAPVLLESVSLLLSRKLRKRKRRTKARHEQMPVASKTSRSYAITSQWKGDEGDMPPSLIKAFFAASSVVSGTVDTVTSTSVVDTATRFNAAVTAPMIDAGAGTTTIPATSFLDDAGNPVPAGSLPAVAPGGSFDVYVNGILQQSELSAPSPTGLVLATADILPGTPVNLAIHNYGGTTSTSTSTPSLTVTTTISS
ncbi:DUF4183 domain-containing protein [Paenibacillus sp. D9]|uniref:DUF4183 domain-containing protein n=2 Tax=Paenibacillus TaxID=44249 RepID=UPI0018DEACC7|nr:DUF4183 domain-containing protein [Paenibacillus sp. D9]